ncbi:hypothetical protein A3A74_08035 [Candidatus Roizmanbacteria bacterium RIFCSPLOWO2_01_FULL_35_13]|uniref:Uncharacterized protein n=1 Tax=Candidatus Roizmanbacteria bacterium RIFCSPLOWO2_01_FULL_35_13 TaxID=1802055 RepID=A0A1F7IG76_9BACT|nr:MAG: hypothetical protein A3A74_08035 [Candidatus Roizmanbacteria bacterium RIFCSPLOWO2_01_FULL_35_13]
MVLVEGKVPWILTSRRLLPEKGDLGQSAMNLLGITFQELRNWGGLHLKLLEIGVGRGLTLQDLKCYGCQIFGIEPTLQVDSKGELKSEYKSRKISDLVYPLMVEDLTEHFNEGTFDIALAVGPNFQNYSSAAPELIARIVTVLKIIKIGGFLTFETQRLTRFGEGISMTKGWLQPPHSFFNLNKFLTYTGIKFEVKERLVPTTESAVIRIFKDKNAIRSLNTSLSEIIINNYSYQIDSK